jgi:hypothetical protein
VGGVALWQPWHHRTQPPLTERLVFDKPPADLSSATFGTSSADSIVPIAGGTFYGEPGANLTREADPRKWAAVLSERYRLDSPRSDRRKVDINGSEGLVLESVVTTVTWWPVKGRDLELLVAGQGLSVDELVAIARSVRLNGAEPSVSDATLLSGMQRIGSATTFARLTALVDAVALGGPGIDPGVGVDVVRYGEVDGYVVASAPAPTGDEMVMLRFVSGGGTATKVHGRAALSSTSSELQDPGRQVVGWVEGGRMVLVAGPGTLEQTRALAESVRPATDKEWSQVKGTVAGPVTTG